MGSSITGVVVPELFPWETRSNVSKDVRRGDGLVERFPPPKPPKLKFRIEALDIRNDFRFGDDWSASRNSASSMRLAVRRLSVECLNDALPVSKVSGVGLEERMKVVVSFTLSLNFVDSLETTR